LSETYSINRVLLTIFSLAVFFSLLSSGSLSVSSVFTDRSSPMGSSMITSASASSDSGGEEGGGDQGGDEEQGRSEEGGGEEDGADDQVDDGEEQGGETGGEEGGEKLTLTPDPDDFPQLIPTPSSPTVTLPKTPGSQLSTLQSLCLIQPNLPQCRSTSASIPLGLSPPTAPGGQSSTLESLCFIDPNRPQCQSTSASIPGLILTPTPNSDNTGVGQAIPGSSIGDLLAPGGSVPLRDPVLVPAPSEEGTAEKPCVVLCPPYEYDEICRNGKDDDFDGKVDEAYPCREVPGESKPRPSDGILTEIPGSPLGPPQN
jgi:hypothetical protein